MQARLLLKKLRALFPSRVPVGVSEFNAWAESFMELYQMPTQDLDSTKFTLASIIMHLGPQAAFVSKHFFFVTIRAAAAKQVAGSVFYEIKQKQALAQKAAEAAAALELQNGSQT